jgi:cell division protein ZapE
MQVISLNGGIDYRLQQKENKMDIRYFVENEEKGTVLFSSLFFQLSKKKAKKQWVKIGKYAYHAEGAFNHIAWFSFHELCENARGKKDYTALAKKFKIWLISSVPPLQPDQYNEVKRFIILIDILYDYGIELWVQGTTIPSLIYTTGKERKAFKRTLSRLIQMTHKNNSII